jgi:transposase
MGTGARVGRRNRSWPEALKREMVAASLAPGSSVSLVARRYDVNANQLFSWRKRYRDEVGGAGAAQLVPVVVTPDRPAAGSADSPDEAIEIAMGSYRLRVGSGVKGPALRLVLDVLEQRAVCRSSGEGR